MSRYGPTKEELRAVQALDCQECGALKGDPCRYSRGPIKGVHVKRVLDLRELSQREGFPTESATGGEGR